MKQLDALERDLLQKIEALQNQVEGVRMAKRSLSGEPEPTASKVVRVRRGINVKAYLLDLLERQGALGLNATQAVEIATKEGKSLERATVSSLLSRFKGDVADYDGQVYRLKKYAGAAMPGTTTENVVRHPASRTGS